MPVKKRADNAEKILYEKKNITVMRPEDHLTAMVFVLSAVISAAVGAIAMEMLDLHIMDLPLIMTAPLVVLGVFHIIRSKWWYLVLVSAVAAVMLVAKVEYVWVVAMVLLSVGIVGVVELVVVLQRFVFYRVVSSVEYLNVRRDLSLWDRLVAFVFNISGDLDTRNLQIDQNISRASTPWKEVWSSMMVSFEIGVFIWIYLSMNPSWMQYDSLASVPVYMFSIMMYIPVIVLPFSIFMSLNVRIRTKYRPFRLYDGIKGTLMRMAVPVFAAFMYVLLAVNKNGFEDVLWFILMSVAFNLFICVASCIVYYKGFESGIVTDIISKWNDFRPVDVMMRLESPDEKTKEYVPDTPRRDHSNLGELVFPEDLT